MFIELHFKKACKRMTGMPYRGMMGMLFSVEAENLSQFTFWKFHRLLHMTSSQGHSKWHESIGHMTLPVSGLE